MDFAQLLSEWSTLISVAAILVGAIVLRVLLKFSTRKIVKTIVSGVRHASKIEQMDSLVAEQRLTQRSKTIASARMLAQHKTHYEQALDAVSPETREAYLAIIQGPALG